MDLINRKSVTAKCAATTASTKYRASALECAYNVSSWVYPATHYFVRIGGGKGELSDVTTVDTRAYFGKGNIFKKMCVLFYLRYFSRHFDPHESYLNF